jgi:hypothetical protein
VTNNLRLEREMIERRWDWMACKAVVDGKVVVAGDDYPTVTVDFLRDPSLTIQLLTTARWSQTGTAAPLTDLGNAVSAAFNLGNSPINRLIFGTTAWGNFTKNAAVLDLLNNQKRNGTSEFSTIPLINNANYQSMGTINTIGGRFELYQYANWYSDVDSNGDLTVRQFLDPTYVVGVGPNMDGAALFGAIMDADANFMAEATVFPKMWKENDPSVVYTMSQSAPLFAPLNPDNTFVIKTE